MRFTLLLFFVTIGVSYSTLLANSDDPINLASRIEIVDHCRKIKDPIKRLQFKLQIIDSIPHAQTAVIVAERAINLADSLGLNIEKAKALRLSGRAWRKWGNQMKSEERLRQAIEIFKSTNQKTSLHQTYRDLGETLRSVRAYHFAREFLQKALNYFKEQKDIPEIGKTYNRLAALYFEKFIWGPYYNSLLQSVTKNRESPEQALQQIEPLQQYADTLENYLDSAYAYLKPTSNWDIYVSTRNIEGAYYTYTFNFDQAKKVFFQLLDDENKIKSDDLALIYINIAHIYDDRFLKKPEKAVHYAKIALDLATESDIKTYQFMASEILSKQYRIMGNYRKAYEYMSKKLKTREAFFIADAEVNAKAQSLEYEILQRDQQLDSKKNQLFIVIASLGCLLLAFTIFNAIIMAKNRKKEKLLEELNRKNTIISEQNTQLEKLNLQKDTYLSIIAHDLRSPAANIVQLSELLNKNIEDDNLSDVQKIASWIQTASQSVLTLLTDLTAWAKSQSDQLSIDQKILPLQQIAAETLETQTALAQQKNVEVISHIPPALKVYADTNLTKTILRNLISNAIKFTPQGGSITIQAEEKEAEVAISITDTGMGMDEKIQKHLFQLSKEKIRQGTDGEASTGLGLMLVKNFVEKQGGTIQFDSTVGKGTTATFTLPAHS